MADFTLTTGSDTVTGSASDDTVNGTAGTLNSGDSLTGGAGTDVLALYGSGTFRVDQLATFTGFESITLNNFVSDYATLHLGSQSIAVTGYGSGTEQVYLGSGAVTFQGGSGYKYVNSSSASNWNAANSIDGGSGSYCYVNLNFNGSDSAVYDLTTNTLSHIYELYGSGNNLTVKINSTVADGIARFYGGETNSTLVTSDATLDLSHSTVTRFTVVSSNATGTNFTVHDLGTAFQIAGGSGTDTITAQDFTFSVDQRNAIFATASVETIVDASGTYTAPPPNPNVFTLTTGSDTVIGTASNDTVNATALTLNSGDSLTGGAGSDALALYGSGTFRVDQLATFTGFESITLNNFVSDYATLHLGSQSIAVTGYGSGTEQVYLGSGAVTFQGGSGYKYVNSSSASNWNAANSIDGGSGSYCYVNLNFNGSDSAVYDLTTNTLSHIYELYGSGNNLTVKINSTVADGIARFYGGETNSTLVTSDATLDLSHSTVTRFTVVSSNATGTNFTVHDLGTAFQIAGGSGTDTITAQDFTFSVDQRNAIFATASVETIVDASGTYTAPPPNPNVFTLTTGSDTVIGTASNDTVNATALTLNSGDSLTGGAGSDALALYGSGTFRVDQLATFTGFESITLNNFVSDYATLHLGSQSIAVTGYGSGTEQVYLGSGAVTFQGGSGYKYVNSSSASNWNAANSIDGGSGSYCYVNLNFNGSDSAVYDLTTNTLSHIYELYGSGNNLTVKINSTVADGIARFYGGETNSTLVTSDATLDLSHSTVTRFTVVSSNATGTNFTVHDLGTAFQIAGGSGTDTITAQDFTFSVDQRNAIFATASVECIVDASGTYISVNQAPTAVALANTMASIAESASTDSPLKVADINITDDALGSNALALTGTDAIFFEIVGTGLFLKAGTILDFESKSSYAVAVTVDDPTVGAMPDATSTIYTLAIANVSGVTINGNSGNNTINATTTVAGQPLPTNEEDTINGGAGKDTINALGGNDFIDGGAGADKMFGGTGNDTYVVDNSGDVVNETGGDGSDLVQSSITFSLTDASHAKGDIENLTLTGTANINGTGNALANEIIGNSGNNILNGLGGADILTGGQGSDKFVFTALAHSTPNASDLITDFVSGSDMFNFSTIDANTSKGGNQAFAFGGQNANVVANSVTWVESNGNTIVQADANGDTTADLQIVLTGTNLNLHATDFIL